MCGLVNKSGKSQGIGKVDETIASIISPPVLGEEVGDWEKTAPSSLTASVPRDGGDKPNFKVTVVLRLRILLPPVLPFLFSFLGFPYS